MFREPLLALRASENQIGSHTALAHAILAGNGAAIIKQVAIDREVATPAAQSSGIFSASDHVVRLVVAKPTAQKGEANCPVDFKGSAKTIVFFAAENRHRMC
jgi:hypothetical protein